MSQSWESCQNLVSDNGIGQRLTSNGGLLRLALVNPHALIHTPRTGRLTIIKADLQDIKQMEGIGERRIMETTPSIQTEAPRQDGQYPGCLAIIGVEAVFTDAATGPDQIGATD